VWLVGDFVGSPLTKGSGFSRGKGERGVRRNRERERGGGEREKESLCGQGWIAADHPRGRAFDVLA